MGSLARRGARVCVVCTDIAKSNINHIKQRPELQPYIKPDAPGQISLDFAILDANKHDSLHLQHRDVRLTVESPSRNPLILIANYVFDSLKYDVFRFSREGVMQEGLVSTW